MKQEDTITFLLDKQKHTCKVVRIITDPLQRHETKCIVSINNEQYGIPISMIETLQEHNKQLTLF